MRHTRRVLGGASAAATVMGLLLLPMAAAQAEGACPTGSTGTISLTADCTLTGTWVVPSGSSIDGNGHTITADAGTYDGAVIRSTTPGTTGQPATTMTVGHVTIDASAIADDSVIVFDGSKGRVNGVTITGGQGSASDTGFGVEIENSQQAVFGATDQVKVDGGTSIHGYEQAAVHVTGGMRFTVLRSTIGNPSSSSSPASGIFVDGLAHGAITENAISLGHDSSANATDYRAGVKVDHTLRVEIKRNVFSGLDADFGVAALNTQMSAKTTAAVDCNLFRRTSTSAPAPFGVAVAAFSTNTHQVNVGLTNSTVEGTWQRTSGTVSGTTVTAGAPNTTNGHCAPSAPGNVLAKGGDGRSKVTWKPASAPGAWAPLTGYKVSAKTAGRPAVVKNVAATATSAQLTGLKNGHTYKVTVSAENNSGHTNGTATLGATKLSLSGPGSVHHGARAHLSGALKSSDPKTHVSKRTLEIWAKPKGGKWKQIGTVKTAGGGHFDISVKPKKTTTYKVVYGGHPGLASSHKTTVAVRG